MSSDQRKTTTVVRRAVLTIFLFGAIGTGTELLLLGHTEDFWQWTPVALIVLSLLALAWRALARQPASLRVFQLTMALFVIGGAIGLYQHYTGNAEFEREMVPTISGFELFKEAMTGATPALAPGALVQLGLLGLVYTHRHPGLGHDSSAGAPTDGNQDQPT